MQNIIINPQLPESFQDYMKKMTISINNLNTNEIRTSLRNKRKEINLTRSDIAYKYFLGEGNNS